MENTKFEKVGKREDYIPWDDYFMAGNLADVIVSFFAHQVVAFLSAQRSKDPYTQVGACIVNQDLKIVGIGYNGFPWGCSDDE
jgi:dCMP deaminase